MKSGKDYIGLGVGAIIHDGGGRILLLKRAGTLDASRSTVGLWSNPGGEVEFGETAEAAAVREAREELGVEIEIEQTIGCSDQILSNSRVHWHLVAFLTRIVRGEPRILEPEKSDDLAWFDVAALPENCGIHHVIVPLRQLGWISEEEARRRIESTPES
jgi:ADP-ribose pyrophosphatase YjhB (NUDIX family)